MQLPAFLPPDAFFQGSNEIFDAGYKFLFGVLGLFFFFIQMTTNVWMPLFLSMHLFYFMKALDGCRECVLSTLRNEAFDIVSSMIIPETCGL